jgi:hypothetical protein
VLEEILTRTIQLHDKDWEDIFPEALFAYKTTWRSTIGFTPYELVYVNKLLLPIEFQVRTLRKVIQLGIDLSDAQNKRVA